MDYTMLVAGVAGFLCGMLGASIIRRRRIARITKLLIQAEKNLLIFENKLREAKKELKTELANKCRPATG